MLQQLLAPQLVVLYVLVGCAVYVHFRGRERLRFARQIGDHSTYLAPYNVLMYAGSAIPNEPVISVERFPELFFFSCQHAMNVVHGRVHVSHGFVDALPVLLEEVLNLLARGLPVMPRWGEAVPNASDPQ